jgi:hypothetical protein
MRLHEPLYLDDGRTIETLADARALVLSLPINHQNLKKWQDIAHLVMRTASTGNKNLLAVIESQIAEALRRPPFAPVRLVEATEKKPAAPSVKRRPKLTAKHRRRLH